MTTRPRIPFWRHMLALIVAGTVYIAGWIAMYLVPIDYLAAFIIGGIWMLLLLRLHYGYYHDL